MKRKLLVIDLERTEEGRTYLVLDYNEALRKTLALLKRLVYDFPLEEYAEVSLGLKPRLGDSVWGSVYSHKEIFKVKEIAQKWRASEPYYVWELDLMENPLGVSILHGRCSVTAQRIEREAGYVIQARFGIGELKAPEMMTPAIDYVDLERV